jgi:hypothetical protein
MEPSKNAKDNNETNRCPASGQHTYRLVETLVFEEMSE